MRRGGMNPVLAGLIAIVLIAIGTYLGFAKDIPFTRPFEVRAVFESANSVRPGSPVRIAGVDVGKVQSVEPQEGTDNAVVVLAIDDDGLPLHEDATAKIRPRIFLEGNFFVDLRPGSPSARVLDDGDSIPVTQTAAPVQLDEVLTALQEDTRSDLKDLLAELAIAFDDGADALNAAYEDAGPALRSTAVVNEALLGTEPGEDLRRLLDGLASASEGLARNEAGLQALIVDLNTTMGAFAAQAGPLRESIAELGPTLDAADRGLAALNDAFPPTRAFAREILPGVRQTPATIAAAFPWMEQARRLIAPGELGGLARSLAPAGRDLAEFVDAGRGLMPEVRLLAECGRDVLLPAGDLVIRDEFETGEENYKEFFYTLVGLAGEGQNFDGNGTYVRFQTGGGPEVVSMGGPTPGAAPLFGNAFPGAATRPTRPARKPPIVDSVACRDSKLPDVNGPWAARGPFSTGGTR